MRVIRSREYRHMPWKNGGGVTLEVAVGPPDAGLDDMGWRISLAQVYSDGPVSRFPGIDRTLSIVRGHGMQLAVAGRPTVTVDPQSHPYSFAGDAAASVKLVDGPVTDLNVMTRRNAHRHVVQRHRMVERRELALRAAITGVVVVEGSATVDCAGVAARLDPLDTALLFPDAVKAMLTATGPSTVLLIQID